VTGGRDAGRLLGVDWGERRIGLALSDETRTLAQPLTTLTRRLGKRFPMRELLVLLEQHDVTGVVVGLPLDQEGREGDAATAVRILAADIVRRWGRPVELWDERLTTVQAQRSLEASEVRGKKAKARIDEAAACTILQAWLDRRRGGA